MTPTAPGTSIDFIRFAVEQQVLRFGEFRTKAGRLSPYFFNAGLFHQGSSLGRLAHFYAERLIRARAEGLQFDLLFGPAYKGISLAAVTAVAMAARGHDIGFCYNRKEAKDHGEGGVLVGAPMQGRVVIIDDVISAGTSVRESVELIRGAGAAPAAVVIALDRMERGGTAEHPSERSAVQEVQALHGLPVIAIATLDDLFDYLGQAESTRDNTHATDVNYGQDAAIHRARIADYRQRYGVGRSA